MQRHGEFFGIISGKFGALQGGRGEHAFRRGVLHFLTRGEQRLQRLLQLGGQLCGRPVFGAAIFEGAQQGVRLLGAQEGEIRAVFIQVVVAFEIGAGHEQQRGAHAKGLRLPLLQLFFQRVMRGLVAGTAEIARDAVECALVRGWQWQAPELRGLGDKGRVREEREHMRRVPQVIAVRDRVGILLDPAWQDFFPLGEGEGLIHELGDGAHATEQRGDGAVASGGVLRVVAGAFEQRDGFFEDLHRFGPILLGRDRQQAGNGFVGIVFLEVRVFPQFGGEDSFPRFAGGGRFCLQQRGDGLFFGFTETGWVVIDVLAEERMHFLERLRTESAESVAVTADEADERAGAFAAVCFQTGQDQRGAKRGRLPCLECLRETRAGLFRAGIGQLITQSAHQGPRILPVSEPGAEGGRVTE